MRAPQFKRMDFKQDWDYHSHIETIYTSGDEYVASYQMITDDEGDKQLSAFYIAPQYRGMGLGDAFLVELLGEYVDDEVWLFVHKDNKVALKMYDKHGFRIHSKKDDNYWWMVKGDGWSDHLFINDIGIK